MSLPSAVITIATSFIFDYCTSYDSCGGSHRRPPGPLHVPRYPVRFITAASLFDGHDAAINIVRRLLQSQGAEVVHLGHNRSVDEVVDAAISEDVQGVAVTSYQGGHLGYFKYLIDRLRAEGRPDIRVYGGGGGVILAREIAELEAYGVARIFSPADGQRLGLARMVNLLVEECDFDLTADLPGSLDGLAGGPRSVLARVITAVQGGALPERQVLEIQARVGPRAPVLGITGTGGSGKSSLTDEIVRRFRLDSGDQLRIAVLAIDPTRRRGGGALLGDRVRMNAIGSARVYFRSLATRGSLSEVPPNFRLVIDACRAAGFDLVIVETPGIGQGASAITDIANVSLYVMTPEFGAPSQLEKIDMLELADVIAINKFDRRGAEDALRDVRRQWARGHDAFSTDPEDLPIFGTIASRLERQWCHCALPTHPRSPGGVGDIFRGRPSPARCRQGPNWGRGHCPDLSRTLPGRDSRDSSRLPRPDGRSGRGGKTRRSCSRHHRLRHPYGGRRNRAGRVAGRGRSCRWR